MIAPRRSGAGDPARGPLRVRLLEPDLPGPRTSGGWRYQDALGARLEAAGIGARAGLAPDGLEAAGALAFEDAAQLVFDSLFLACAEPPTWLADERCAGRRWMLLHYLPSLDPTVEPAAAARLAERERAWLAALDGVVASSESLAEQLARTHGVRAAVASPGVEALFRTSGTPPAREGPLEVLCVGPLTPAKNQLLIARALSAVARATGGALRLVLLGDAGADPEYARRVEAAAQGLELVLPGSVAVERVAAAMARCDLFVSASLFESFGMAVAEAVASGCLVLATDVGEARRFVVEGRNGRLVPPDRPEAFEAALAELLAECVAGPRLERGFERLRVPTWEHTTAAFLAALGLRFDVPHGAAPARTGAVELYSSCRLPTRYGEFDVGVYRIHAEAREALLISKGDLEGGDPPLVRIHSECFTGEILHSLKCDCEAQLAEALREVSRQGRGAVVYLRQEGRGIGLGNKIAAYAHQEDGADTVDANAILGLPADLRQFGSAAAILRARGVRAVQANTNNPDKVAALVAGGIEVVAVVPSHPPAAIEAHGYLATKSRRLGHALGAFDAPRADRPRPRLIVFDVDGVLQHDERVDPAAMATLEGLRRAGFLLRFLTNDGINSRRTRLAAMSRIGLELPADELYTAATLGRRWLDARGIGSILPLMGDPALEEFRGLDLAPERPGAVVVGDWFGHYDPAVLAAAHRALEAGSPLLALHKKRSWPTRGGRHIDLGFWVAGLEYCAGVDAELAAKPAEFAYRAVLEDSGCAAAETLMLADEVDPDLLGAGRVGIETLLLDPSGAGDERVDGSVRTLADAAAWAERRAAEG